MSDTQKFRFEGTWEIGSVGILRPSAMRSALEKLFQKAKVAGKVTIMEVTEIETSTIIASRQTTSGTNPQASEMHQRTVTGSSKKDVKKT